MVNPLGHMEQNNRKMRARALELSAPARRKVRAQLKHYLACTGLVPADFASRIDYAPDSLAMFLEDHYHEVSGNAAYICQAITKFIAAHPIAPSTQAFGELYDTANVRAMRQSFQQLLRRPAARLVYGAPGKQKSFALEYLVAELNRNELAKNGAGRRAYYLYIDVGMTQGQIVREVAAACGVPAIGDRVRIRRNLAFEFRERRALLVVDEAQHLGQMGFETLKILLDRPPHFSLLFAGSHDLKIMFDRFSASLEQWNSRLLDKVCLPGVSVDEAKGIAQRELGDYLRTLPAAEQRDMLDGMINDSIVWDVFADQPPSPQMLKHRPSRSNIAAGNAYINVRTLTNSLEETKAQLAEEAV
jgi:hypothetical protein